MASSGSEQQELQSLLHPALEIPEILPEVIDPAPDELPEALLIEDPIDSVRSNISGALLGRICLKHNLSLDDVLLPGVEDRPHNPPEGYTAFYRHACAAGTLPPFNQYIREMLSFIGIAPGQLHPNGHALLNSVFILFMDCLFRPPKPAEIRHIFNFKSRGDSPSFTFLEAVRNCQVVTGAWTRLSYFKNEWFFVRCPPGFARRWLSRRECRKIRKPSLIVIVDIRTDIRCFHYSYHIEAGRRSIQKRHPKFTRDSG